MRSFLYLCSLMPPESLSLFPQYSGFSLSDLEGGPPPLLEIFLPIQLFFAALLAPFAILGADKLLQVEPLNAVFFVVGSPRPATFRSFLDIMSVIIGTSFSTPPLTDDS